MSAPDASPAPISPGRLLGSVIGVGLLFAAVGTALGLRVIALMTLQHILVPGGNLDFQEVSDRLPVPRLLDWNPSLIDGMLALSQMSLPVLLVIGVLLFLLLGLLAVRVMHPSFRFFVPLPAAAINTADTRDIQKPPANIQPQPVSTSPSKIAEEEDDAFEPAFDFMTEGSDTPDGSAPEPVPLAAEMTTPSEEVIEEVPNPPDASVESGGYAISGRLNGAELGRALARLILVGLTVLVVWLLTSWLRAHWGMSEATAETVNPPRIGLMPRLFNRGELLDLLPLLTLGIAFWLFLGRDRLFASPSRGSVPVPTGTTDSSLTVQSEEAAMPAVPESAWPRILTGALFGLGAYGLLRWAMPGPLQTLLMRYHTLGTFHQGYWNRIAGAYLLSAGAVWFALGALLYALGRPNLRPFARLALLAMPALAVLIALSARRPLDVRSQAARFDWKPSVLAAALPYRPDHPVAAVPAGEEAGQEFSALTHIPQGTQPAQPERNVLLFFPNGPLNVRQQGVTEDNLTADPASAKPAQKFLESRRYESALSWTAIKHLYNVGTMHFDNTAAMQACMTDMIRCPHLSQCGMTTRNMLFTSAASPQNRAILDQWANESLFAHPTRASVKLMGDLYRRFGAVSEAQKWYRRADMPPTFMERIQKEKPLFHDGKVTGTLIWNGKPLSGVQVGVIPHRLNGLPPDLEQNVLIAARELLTYYPRPFSFRWVIAGTTTDSAGQFTLQYLTEGDYLLVCTLPPNVTLAPPSDPALQVRNAPPRLLLNYNTPTQDLGKIELSYKR